MGIVTDLIYIILAALFGGIVAHLFRQPLIFGYILAGVIVGPYTGGFTVERIHDIETLAEVGVALLLFTLGLEFSFGELKRLARITFLGTPIQILLCTVSGHFIAQLIGLSWNDALWVGGAISLSSTMVVLKTLSANDSLDSTSGKLMLAILIAQDLAVVPLILLLPELTSESSNYLMIGRAIIKSGLFLVFMYFAGTWLFPRIFSFIARWGSRELFFLSTLGVAFGAGLASYQLGLSFALGAFVAGMLLSETDFNHQALSDVSSLRDLFGLIFFVSVGMLFDPRFFISHIGTIALLALAIISVKALITGGIVRSFGFKDQVSWKVGLGLAQVGEFAFVIANTGKASGNLSLDSYSLMISVTVVSMVVTPALFSLSNILVARFSSNGPEAEPVQEGRSDLKEHVLIVGGGVVGQYVAKVLGTLQIPYVVIEFDHKIVTQMRDQGMSVVYGDGTRRVILETAKVAKASLVVITTTNDKILPLILEEIRQLNDQVPVVVRVEEVEDVQNLALPKIHEIVQPQLEVGLEIVHQALLALGTKEIEIFTLLGQLRAERYRPEGQTKNLASDILRLKVSRLLEFIWLEVNENCSLARQTLGELRLREKYGITVVALLRGEDFTANPGPEFRIASGDVLGVLGSNSQLSAFRKVFGETK